MTNPNRLARPLTLAGCAVLVISAVLHVFGGIKVGFPALAASNLNPAVQSAFQVVFLSLGWHWIMTAVVTALASAVQTRLRNAIVLFCGAAVLLEALAGAWAMGWFIGNEMIGAAAILLLCGGLLFRSATPVLARVPQTAQRS